MSPITTHVLDTSRGKPATGITVLLFHQQPNEWKELNRGITDNNGRITSLLADDWNLETGSYKLRFMTADYYELLSAACFYPLVEIIFEVTANEHYHVPLLLNPFGYSTYRGS